MRAVPPDRAPDRGTGRLWYGRSDAGGLRFRMDPVPALVPGEGADSHGCEDPTVVPTEAGLVVYYTGVDADRRGHLCYATGPDARSLVKRGVALSSSKSERNTKEATPLRADGGWRPLYEYAHDGHSRVGLADARDPRGRGTSGATPSRPGRTAGTAGICPPGPCCATIPSDP